MNLKEFSHQEKEKYNQLLNPDIQNKTKISALYDQSFLFLQLDWVRQKLSKKYYEESSLNLEPFRF